LLKEGISYEIIILGLVKEIIKIPDKITDLEFINITNNRICNARATLYKAIIKIKIKKRSNREREAHIEDNAEMLKVVILDEISR